MKTLTDLVPAERLLVATLRLAGEPLTLTRLVQESGYSTSTHIKMCLRYLVRAGLVVETDNPAASSKDDRILYSLAAQEPSCVK